MSKGGSRVPRIHRKAIRRGLVLNTECGDRPTACPRFPASIGAANHSQSMRLLVGDNGARKRVAAEPVNPELIQILLADIEELRRGVYLDPPRRTCQVN